MYLNVTLVGHDRPQGLALGVQQFKLPLEVADKAQHQLFFVCVAAVRFGELALLQGPAGGLAGCKDVHTRIRPH